MWKQTCKHNFQSKDIYNRQTGSVILKPGAEDPEIILALRLHHDPRLPEPSFSLAYFLLTAANKSDQTDKQVDRYLFPYTDIYIKGKK